MKLKVGKKYMVKLRDNSLNCAFPWGKTAVPVRITDKHEHFYVGTVLTHRNPEGFGQSKPYVVSFSKLYIKEKAFEFTEVEE